MTEHRTLHLPVRIVTPPAAHPHRACRVVDAEGDTIAFFLRNGKGERVQHGIADLLNLRVTAMQVRGMRAELADYVQTVARLRAEPEARPTVAQVKALVRAAQWVAEDGEADPTGTGQAKAVDKANLRAVLAPFLEKEPNE